MSEQVKGTSLQAVPQVGRSFLGAIVAEIIGTYTLVFVGAGTVIAVLLATPDAAANRTAISIAFGLAVMIVVYAFGHVSGAHINPTVTVGLAAVKRFPWRAVPAYLAAQLAGGILASLSHWLLFGNQARTAAVILGTTPVGDRGPGTAFVAEVILGFLLVVVVLATATDDRAIPAGAGLAIGFVIAAGIYVTLTVSGGSFNAVRSLAPMIVAGQFPGWWVYLIAPVIGGVLGAVCYDRLARAGAPPS